MIQEKSVLKNSNPAEARYARRASLGLNAKLDEFEINTVFRQAAFISQTSYESMEFTLG
jgi:predicted chitinase